MGNSEASSHVRAAAAAEEEEDELVATLENKTKQNKKARTKKQKLAFTNMRGNSKFNWLNACKAK